MRDLNSPWRWPLAGLVAILLVMIITGGAAKLFPEGVLGTDQNRFRIGPPLLVLDIHVLPEEPAPEPEEDLPRESPPPRNLDLFQDIWQGWVATRSDEIVVVPGPAVEPEPSLHFGQLDWAALATAPPDTSAKALLARAALLQDMGWQRLRPLAEMRIHGIRAQRYKAMKKSVFNQNWLEDEYLR